MHRDSRRENCTYAYIYQHPYVHAIYAYMMSTCDICVYIYICAHTYMTCICMYTLCRTHGAHLRAFTQMEFVNVTPRIRTHVRPRTCKNSEMNSANRTHTPSQSRTQQKREKKEKKEREKR